MLLLLPLMLIIVAVPTMVKSHRLTYIVLGSIFIIAGIIMPELKPNRWIGIRIKWTMEEPDICDQVHRIAGPLWIIGGYLVILETVFLPLRWIGPVMRGIIFLLSAFSLIHAWQPVRKKSLKKQRASSNERFCRFSFGLFETF